MGRDEIRKNRIPINRRAMLACSAAVGITLTLPKPLRVGQDTVNFYNWDTYIGETTITDLTRVSNTGS